MTLLPETWRYVDCGAVDACENNAQMAVLARSATDAEEPILETSVWCVTTDDLLAALHEAVDDAKEVSA